MGRLLFLALACVCGLGWVQAFRPLSPSLVALPKVRMSSPLPCPKDTGPKAVRLLNLRSSYILTQSGSWGHERWKPSTSSLAGWGGLVLGGTYILDILNKNGRVIQVVQAPAHAFLYPTF
jgi:hypothetical protein